MVKPSLRLVLGFLALVWLLAPSYALGQLFCPCFIPTGLKRSTPTADFKVDCSTLPSGLSCDDFKNAVIKAVRTWNNVGTNFQFNLTPNNNSINIIKFGPLSAGQAALTSNQVDLTTGLIQQTTLTFSSDESWSTTGTLGTLDIQGVATHEFGHWLNLDDVLGLRCKLVTMSASIIPGSSGKYLRTLTGSDKKGIRFVYGPNPPKLLADLKVPLVELAAGFDVKFDIENSGCGPAAPTTHDVHVIRVGDGADVLVANIADPLPLPPRNATFPCPGPFCPRRSFGPFVVFFFAEECFYRVIADAPGLVQENNESNNTGVSPHF